MRPTVGKYDTWCRQASSKHTHYFVYLADEFLWYKFTSLGPRQNGSNFTDDILKFFNENCFISIQISLKVTHMATMNNTSALVPIMAWHWTYHVTHSSGLSRCYVLDENVYLRSCLSLQCRHIERDGISNHRRIDCFPNRLFRRR